VGLLAKVFLHYLYLFSEPTQPLEHYTFSCYLLHVSAFLC